MIITILILFIYGACLLVLHIFKVKQRKIRFCMYFEIHVIWLTPKFNEDLESYEVKK